MDILESMFSDLIQGREMNTFRVFVFIALIFPCSGCLSFNGVSSSWLINKDARGLPLGEKFRLNCDVQSKIPDKPVWKIPPSEIIPYRETSVSYPEIAMWYQTHAQVVGRGTELTFKSALKTSTGMGIWPFPGILFPFKTRYQFYFRDEKTGFEYFFVGNSKKWWRRLPLTKLKHGDNGTIANGGSCK